MSKRVLSKKSVFTECTKYTLANKNGRQEAYSRINDVDDFISVVLTDYNLVVKDKCAVVHCDLYNRREQMVVEHYDTLKSAKEYSLILALQGRFYRIYSKKQVNAMFETRDFLARNIESVIQLTQDIKDLHTLMDDLHKDISLTKDCCSHDEYVKTKSTNAVRIYNCIVELSNLQHVLHYNASALTNTSMPPPMPIGLGTPLCKRIIF